MAIMGKWLQVTTLAAGDVGLAADDTFYYGNAVGEGGNSNTDAIVNATDEILARNNPHWFGDPALLDDPYDYNRDQRVNATDEIIARNNQTFFVTALQLITVTGGAGAGQSLAEWTDPTTLQGNTQAIGEAIQTDTNSPQSLADNEPPMARPVGDANHDNRFDSLDLVTVYQAGEYEDDIPQNSTLEEGDWNGDGDFTAADLIFAFQTSDYVIAASPLNAAVVGASDLMLTSAIAKRGDSASSDEEPQDIASPSRPVVEPLFIDALFVESDDFYFEAPSSDYFEAPFSALGPRNIPDALRP